MIYIILVIILLIVLRLLVIKNRKHTVSIRHIQTCSDIRGLRLNIKSGICSLNCADSFALDVPTGTENMVKSEIKNGIWHINADMGDNFGHIGIRVPSVMTFDEVTVTSDMANTVINGISAHKISANIQSGIMEIKGANAEYASFKNSAGCLSALETSVDRGLTAVCGTGKLLFDGTVNSDAKFECGAGHIDASINNEIKEYNIYSQCSMGTINIDNEPAQAQINNNSSKNIRLECGAGSIFVKFKTDMGSVDI